MSLLIPGPQDVQPQYHEVSMAWGFCLKNNGANPRRKRHVQQNFVGLNSTLAKGFVRCSCSGVVIVWYGSFIQNPKSLSVQGTVRQLSSTETFSSVSSFRRDSAWQLGTVSGPSGSSAPNQAPHATLPHKNGRMAIELLCVHILVGCSCEKNSWNRPFQRVRIDQNSCLCRSSSHVSCQS